MIDIHHHCLPGVDDGPQTLEEAVELCRLAATDGITKIVATPHVLRGRWQNRERPALETALATLRDASGGTPEIVLGSEYFFSFDVNEVLEAGEGIIPLAGSRCILLEFDANSIPPLVEQPLFRMQLDRWIPIVAHPERNAVLQSKPALMERLAERGVRFQVTAGSIVGDFGSVAERCARRWIEQGLVHFVASDAHNTSRRPPRMTAAREALQALVGSRVADALVRDNPEAALAGRALPWDPEPTAPPRGLLGRLIRRKTPS